MIDWNLKIFESLNSTNTELAKYADDGADEGLVVQALQQTSGRGRLGREWFSPENGLYMSLLLKPDISPEYIKLLSLAVGVALAEAVRKETGLAVQLKWPNDAILSGKKLAGILQESKFTGDKLQHVICGIGFNLNQEISQFPEEIRPISTSLFIEAGKKFDPEKFTGKILESVNRWYQKLEAGDNDSILESYRSLSFLDGKSVRIEDDEVYNGEVSGITDKGALEVMTEAGTKEFYTGSIVEILVKI